MVVNNYEMCCYGEQTNHFFECHSDFDQKQVSLQVLNSCQLSLSIDAYYQKIRLAAALMRLN